MASRKLNGAELARELEGLTSPGLAEAVNARSGQPEGVQAVGSPPPSPPTEIVAQLAEPPPHPRPRTGGSMRARGGRPAKAGVDGMPVNVRLSQADHLALAKLAGKLVVPGRPMPTVQDVVRGIIRGALREPELATRFCRQTDA
jgi:hypothetical protein